MITQIFDVLGQIITAFIGCVTSLFSGVVDIFYNAEQGQLTVVGTLSLIALGTGLVIWAFYFIKRLITSATTRGR